MGMFDTGGSPLSRMWASVEFQTKAGACLLRVFDVERGVPPEIAVDLQYDTQCCLECNTEIELIPLIPLPLVPMRPRAVR